MIQFVFWASETGKVHGAESAYWTRKDFAATCQTLCHRNLSGHARSIYSAGKAPGGGKVTCKRCREMVERDIERLVALLPEAPENESGGER